MAAKIEIDPIPYNRISVVFFKPVYLRIEQRKNCNDNF
jgi:hypothetical protein